MEYNKVAAKWWADRLRNVELDNFNYGDDSSIGVLTMIFATMLANHSKPSGKAIDVFEEKLAYTINEHVKASGSVTLSVDYHPDWILTALAHETGINTNGFPWKITMVIEKDKVSVQSANRESVIIFPESAE